MREVGYYAILPAKVRHSKDLNSNEKLLFAEISALSNKNGYCTASNGYLGELLGSNERSVSRHFSSLRKHGFIRVELIRVGKEIKERRVYPLMDHMGNAKTCDNQMITVRYNNNGEYIGTTIGYDNDKSGSAKNDYTPIDKSGSAKNDYAINTSLSNITSSNSNNTLVEPKAQQPSPIPKIIEYLNTVANKKFKPNTSATTKLLNARLSDGYTLQEIKYVIDNKTAEWLNTDMQKYLRPETLFNATKFESYVNEPSYKPKKSQMDAVQDIMNMSFEQREVERIEQERNHAIDSDDTNLLPW